MVAEYLSCPFCGFGFAREDTLCRHGCPLASMCRLSRCPNCQYEFAEEPPVLSWLGVLLRRRRRSSAEPLPQDVLSVRDLAGGERGRVLCLGAGGVSRRNTLAVFGVVPGAEITLLQQRPSCVLRVGETELALDSSIAREILVERLVTESK